MKILALLSCLLAATSAGHIGHGYAGGYGHHHSPIHIPVIGPHGVPVEAPEVAHAHAAHAAAHAEAAARSGYHHHYEGFGHGGVGIGHIDEGHIGGGYQHHHYHGPIHLPVIGKSGVPIDTPEVAHARAAHAVAHAEAAARSHHHGGIGHEGGYGGHHGYAHEYAHSGEHIRYHGPNHIPVIGKGGVPLDTPAVAHARKEHAIAYAETVVRDATHGHEHHIDGPHHGQHQHHHHHY